MEMCVIEDITSRGSRAAAVANVFARGILLPEKRFRQEVRKNGNILRVAKLFQVSTVVVRIRAKELGMKGHGF